MEVHACLENCERELFITLKENEESYNPETNPRVDQDLEKKILEEYKKAKFEPMNDELSIAETDSFKFRKNTGESDSKVVWVEPLDQSMENTIII